MWFLTCLDMFRQCLDSLSEAPLSGTRLRTRFCQKRLVLIATALKFMDSLQAPHIFHQGSIFSVVLHASNHFGIFRHCEASFPSPKQLVCLERCCARSVRRRTFELLVTTTLNFGLFMPLFQQRLIQYDRKSLQPYHAVLRVYGKWNECGSGKESFCWFASIMALTGGDAFGPAWCRCKFVWIDALDPIRCFKTQDPGTMPMLYVSLQRNASVLAGEKPGYDSGIPMPLSATRSDIQKYIISKNVNGTDSWNQSQGP